LFSAVEGGEWSASRTGVFTSIESSSLYPLDLGLLGFRVDVGMKEKQ
jgi:hypothetical protein